MKSRSEVERPCCTHGEIRNTYKILVGKVGKDLEGSGCVLMIVLS
jgi:hypothetical protein